jgi:hypothetical protein
MCFGCCEKGDWRRYEWQLDCHIKAMQLESEKLENLGVRQKSIEVRNKKQPQHSILL